MGFWNGAGIQWPWIPTIFPYIINSSNHYRDFCFSKDSMSDRYVMQKKKKNRRKFNLKLNGSSVLFLSASKSPYKTTQKKIEEGPNGFHLLKGVIFSFFLQSKNTARRFFSHLMNHKAKSSLTPESPKPKCLYLFYVHPIMVFRRRRSNFYKSSYLSSRDA